MRSFLGPAFVLALSLGTLLLPLAPAMPPGLCSDERLGVTLSPDDTTPYSVHGVLCDHTPRRRAIQLLVAGATESGPGYWDFPHPDYYRAQPAVYGPMRDRYSYVQYLAEAGFASFTVDRIGTGASSHPPAVDVTIPSNAYVLHQVTQALRRGDLGFAYERVIGVGRSLGAGVLYEQSVDYGGLDGLLIQDFRQHRQPPFFTFPDTFVPAQTEPRLADRPAGYLTTRVGTRELFFYAPTAEASVMQHEERLKDTITDGEIVTFPDSFDYTRSVVVPVFSIVGDRDTLFCSGPGCPEADQEAAHFPLARCFESVVVPDAGHSMNLQTNNRDIAFPAMLDWVQRFLHPGGPC